MNFSSNPAAVSAEQFRVCSQCKASNLFPFTPSTAVPCGCGGEYLAVSSVAASDLRAERTRCADALERLAVGCEGAGDVIPSANAAAKMRELAQWIRVG
jgi:hypothetical protein